MSYIFPVSTLSLSKFLEIRLHSFGPYRVLMIILISLCDAPTEVEAQNSGIICTHYNVNNGLTTNSVEYVFVDGEGYVWFATTSGLQQFDGFNFVNYLYNSDDSSSISYNFISTISEDQRGNIWIGTLGKGLNIFSKEKGVFYHLRNELEDASYLTSNIIPRGRKVIAKDSQGFLWINTLMGLNKINIDTRSVEQFKGDLAGDILFDKELRVLWIVSDRLKKFNTETKKIEHFYINENVLRSVTNIGSIIMDRDGLIWLGTDAGMVLFDRPKGQFQNLPSYLNKITGHPADSYFWSLKPVNALYEDNKGFIWVAIEKSLYKINKINGEYLIYNHEVDNPNSLLDEKITGIYGNNSGVLWISYMGKGVSKINLNLKEFKQYRQDSRDPNSLSGNVVRSIYKDGRQNLWIGMYSEGLNRIFPEVDKKTIHYKYDPLDNRTISSNYITSIYVDRQNRLWIGTFDKGFCFAENIYSAENLEFTRFHFDDNLEVQDIKEDSAGRIWIGSQNGLYIYDPSTNQLNHYGDLVNQISEVQGINIQSMIYEEPNLLWIASWNRGLCRLYINSEPFLTQQNKKDSLIIYDNINDIDNSKIDNSFTTIYKDKFNTIWLGSNVNGLIKVIDKDGRMEFIKYDKLKGATDNSVYGIASDDSGNIWISTTHGLGKFNPEKEQFNSYYESDGILSNTFLWDASFRSAEGELFFGGINGLISFFPDRIINDISACPIHISKIVIQNKEVKVGDKINGRILLSQSIQYTDHITLTHLERAFSLEFVALNTPDPEEIKYAYKLEGFDQDWFFAAYDRRFVTYTNLRHGTYQFKVRSSNSDGIWNEQPVVLNIRILPPWWRTSLALVSFTVMFILLLYLFRRLILMRARLIHEARLEHMQREKAEALYNVKMELLTDISHEFRTPLSLILAPLQKIISSVAHDPRLIKQSTLIRKNADRLLRLIDQITDLRKIDLNKLTLKLKKENIIEFLSEITSSFDEIAQQRSMSLEFYSEVKSCETYFDENCLEKIMYNLLSNAFKYTPNGGVIQVCCKLLQNGIDPSLKILSDIHDGDYIEITVRDNGIGIPQEHIGHLYERFFRVERHDSIIRRGTGIGLALTKELVELHRGKIFLQSDENIGTCFKIQLPLNNKPGTDDKITEINKEGKDKTGSLQPYILTEEHEYTLEYSVKNVKPGYQEKNVLILLVDDEVEVRNFLRDYLEESYQICEASNGVDGLEIAISNNPDIIITDVIMPVMDGNEMCRKLKEDIRTSHIPVIMLTARSSMDNRIEGLETGSDAYIEKPFSIDFIEVQIKNLLDNRKMLRNKFSKEMILKPSELTITPLDAQFLQKAINIVEKHMEDSDFGSDVFCREIGISRSQLHRKLKALTSQPASEFIRALRLKRAVSLLERSQLSVEEISYKVGFNHPAYFSKCFKNTYGKTPSEFKEK